MNLAGRIILHVSLWVRSGTYSAFVAYERKVLPLIAEHGGRLECALKLNGSDQVEPTEIHILSFASKEEFEKYRSDERLVELSEERAACLIKTEIAYGTQSELFT
ncbi:hypothetical protein [uncultured Litoreibacter sp.]|uniref:hypothetical protein n=1 Tax=uncultured Litoreibacter sp. TaxID=1392394 RepID=UPI00260982F8|nr:hypothetical protein [uncultured Litoreibacter sp.]